MAATVLDPGTHESDTVATALAAARRSLGFGTHIDETLDWCVEVGRSAPMVGGGRTAELWQLLAGTAAIDVTAARMLEPHLDALSILDQSGMRLDEGSDPWGVRQIGVGPESTWGVFAAEGSGMRLEARQTDEGWVLTGTKPWCSLADRLTHALVTAHVGDNHRRLFAVDLRASGVTARKGPWFARGLRDIVSAPVDFDDAVAVPVGGIGWYLTRPGFAWGGMSVAACWWGGAVGIADALRAPARSERADQLSLVHLGRADAALWAARATLAEAARLIDAGSSAGLGDGLLADRVRQIVMDAATLTLGEADAALGPAPLVTDQSHARRVADLHLYLRQHHGLRDTARIGRALAAEGTT